MNRRSFFSAIAAAPLVASPAISSAAVPPPLRRISNKLGDPGYETWVQTKGRHLNVKITLNGAPVDAVITADENERLIIRHADIGKRIRGIGDLTETLHGEVRVEFEPRAGNL